MQNEYLQYKVPAVRDLAWALRSSPLMNLGTTSSCLKEYEESKELLQRIDAEPEAFLSELKFWPQRRLGDYYESLWSFWIRNNPRYELLEQNLQINIEGKTLGEFDFIVKDLERDKVCHWEVSVKFYLAYEKPEKQSSWYGLQFRDRLDIKVQRLMQHQCQLSKIEAVKLILKEKNIAIDEVRMILKGRLFYPSTKAFDSPPEGSNPDHLKSLWLTLSQFEQPDHRHDFTYLPLDKAKWFSPQSDAAKSLSYEALVEKINKGQILVPICLAAMKDSIEQQRFFLCPDGWKVPDEFLAL